MWATCGNAPSRGSRSISSPSRVRPSPAVCEAEADWSLARLPDQAALVSNCEHDLLTECFESQFLPSLAARTSFDSFATGFKTVLFNPGRVPIETFIRWADQCFERICTSSEGQRRPAPRSLLVRWSFVSSQIIRDLTLRFVALFRKGFDVADLLHVRCSSAPSFGSFQIISLFLEEFLSFQVSPSLPSPFLRWR